MEVLKRSKKRSHRIQIASTKAMVIVKPFNLIQKMQRRVKSIKIIEKRRLSKEVKQNKIFR
jgi:hypothetical protein